MSLNEEMLAEYKPCSSGLSGQAGDEVKKLDIVFSRLCDIRAQLDGSSGRIDDCLCRLSSEFQTPVRSNKGEDASPDTKLGKIEDALPDIDVLCDKFAILATKVETL